MEKDTTSNIKKIQESGESVSVSHSYIDTVVSEDDSLCTSGFNNHGQLGLGDTTNRTTPTRVGSAKDWDMITCGSSHILVLKQDGSLWSWGSNNSGQLGIGNFTNKHTPTQVGNDTSWVMITCGNNHTVGLKQDGSLWSWGYNGNGQLGLGTSGSGTNRNTPTQVGSDKDWVMITCGSSHTVGLKQDGSLWAWGFNGNSFGQLGLGDTTTKRTTPTQVGSDKDWAMITCGSSHTLGLKQDGSLWSWGYNGWGQLGLGDSGTGANRNIPTQVGSDKDWEMITSSYHHTLGQKQDGSLWSWGFNFYGQLGLGNTTKRTTPTQVGSDTNWVMITGGNEHTVGLKQDGSLWSWGYNSEGQLGLGNTTQMNTPTRVGSDNDWVMITCGAHHTLGLKQDGSLWSWGYNDRGQLGLEFTPDDISMGEL